MTQIRKKQKRLYGIMKFLIIFTAVLLFLFIGAQPYIKAYSESLSICINYFCDISVVASLIVIFVYYSRYGKCDYVLTCAEDEINDAGCYYTARECSAVKDFANEINEDLSRCKFNVATDIKCNDFTFDLRAYKGKEYFYLVCVESLDKNDVLAYLDEALLDLTAKNLKRKGDAVICFVTDKAQDSAVELSKMITPYGRKNQLKIALAILETDTKKVFFNGYRDTRTKKMIANYVMNCNIPIKEQYISDDKLEFQNKLRERLDNLTLKEIKNDNFYIH